MVVEPGFLAGIGQQSAITGDRSCPTCDYDLRGLKVGDPCPECGEQIRPLSGRGSIHDNLVLAPVGFLRNLRFAFILLALSLPVVIGGLFALRWGLGRPFPAAVAVLVASVAWWFGVVLATEPRRSAAAGTQARRLERRRMRWLNRSVQGFWAVAAMLILFKIHATGAAKDWLEVGRAISTLAALFGLAPLAWHLSDIAEWGQDDDLAERLRLSAWGVAGAGVVVFLTPILAFLAGPLAFFVGFVGLIAALIWPLTVILLEVCLIQFIPMVNWSIRNWAAAREREARRIEKAERARSEAMAEAERAGGAAPPPRHDVRLLAAMRRELRAGPVTERAAAQDPPADRRELNPYELEPDR